MISHSFMIKFMVKNIGVISALVVSGYLAFNDCQAGLKIYYIRHAEGGHNVKEDWKHIPKNLWPSYVGDSGQFTPKGKVEQSAVSKKLQKYEFDFIASSPIWRARQTILPYLKEMDAQAEIWPELAELSARSVILKKGLPKPKVKILGEGDEIEISDDEAEYFTLRPNAKHEFEMPDFDDEEDDDEREEKEAGAAKVVIKSVLDLIQERFGGTDKTILLVGHGSSGKAIFRMLTQDKQSGIDSILNTGIWMAEEQSDGSFDLIMHNDKPWDD